MFHLHENPLSGCLWGGLVAQLDVPEGAAVPCGLTVNLTRRSRTQSRRCAKTERGFLIRPINPGLLITRLITLGRIKNPRSVA